MTQCRPNYDLWSAQGRRSIVMMARFWLPRLRRFPSSTRRTFTWLARTVVADTWRLKP